MEEESTPVQSMARQVEREPMARMQKKIEKTGVTHLPSNLLRTEHRATLVRSG